jgi:hypothetical protein
MADQLFSVNFLVHKQAPVITLVNKPGRIENARIVQGTTTATDTATGTITGTLCATLTGTITGTLTGTATAGGQYVSRNVMSSPAPVVTQTGHRQVEVIGEPGTPVPERPEIAVENAQIVSVDDYDISAPEPIGDQETIPVESAAVSPGTFAAAHDDDTDHDQDTDRDRDADTDKDLDSDRDIDKDDRTGVHFDYEEIGLKPPFVAEGTKGKRT